jgi:hypothetical protein
MDFYKLYELNAHRMQYLWETGLLNHWVRKYTPNVDKCLKSNPRATRNLALKLIDLSSAFVLLTIGYGITLVAFVSEIVFRKRSMLRSSSRL